jgi:processive 1,2-diacylglycerol beta-glucosyltransferase
MFAVYSKWVPLAPGGRQRAFGHGSGKVLILAAGVGRGHQSAAEGLRDELLRMAPDVRVTVHNGLGASRGPLRVFLEHFTRWQLTHWPSAYSFSYAVGVRWKLGRQIALGVLYGASRSRLGSLIDAEEPDVVVSTYPGITAPLGVMRQRGQLHVPVCALVTDLASLHFWAHPGADLHLASYPESLREIAAITGGAPARAARPPLSLAHWNSPGRCSARRALGLDPEPPLIVVSGGGWGIGDLRGAISAALAVEQVQVIVVCGENEPATRRLSSHYASHSQVRVLGYTHAMADLLGAANVLVHSTGGMTCLEAAAQGCPVIAYGFARGHVRHNTQAMVRHGLIRHAKDSDELTRELRQALGRSQALAPYAHDRACASTAILDLIGHSSASRAMTPARIGANA